MRRALVLAVVGLSAVAWADKKHPNPFLSQAKAFFSQGDGEKCLKRLIQAGDKWKHNDKHDLADIELYGGMCGYLTGEQQAAEVSFQRALKLDPKITLPPDAGAGIEGLWAKVTGKPVPIASSAPPPQEKPKKDEAKPKQAEPAPPPAPPGPPASEKKSDVARNDAPVDQRLTPAPQDDVRISDEATQPKKGRNIIVPVVLGVGAVASGVVGIVLGLQAKSLQTQYNDAATFQADADKIKPQAQTDALVTNILFAAAGALLVGAIAILIFSGS
jgi:hypothetical protein